jgi:5-methylthioadenosine/S-adenosylhomocysteine deaminase
MMTRRFSAARILTPDGWQAEADLVVRDGRVESVGPRQQLESGPAEADSESVDLGRLVLLPGTVNAHNHSFQSLLRGRTEDRSFFAWRDVLYHFGGQMGPEQLEVGALLAYGEMLLRGVTTVVDFFYIHNQSNEAARAAIRAAGRLGMRLVLARSMIDGTVQPPAYRESIEQAVEHTRELWSEVRDDPLASVIPAPHSPHGASGRLIQAGARLAEELNTTWHSHVAEGQYEGERTRREYGLPPLAWIDSLGALSERTCIVHGVWLEDEEIELLGRRGGKLVYCPSSNMFLGDGITPLPKYLQAGVTIALGSDGGCGNNRVSVFEEMRMASLLQSVATLDPSVLTGSQAFAMGTRNGAAVTGLPVGGLAPGQYADFVALDPTDLSLLPAPDLLANVVYSMEPAAIRRVYVHGREVMADRRLLGVSAEEIATRLAEVSAWLDRRAQS